MNGKAFPILPNTTLLVLSSSNRPPPSPSPMISPDKNNYVNEDCKQVQDVYVGYASLIMDTEFYIFLSPSLPFFSPYLHSSLHTSTLLSFPPFFSPYLYSFLQTFSKKKEKIQQVSVHVCHSVTRDVKLCTLDLLSLLIHWG